MSVTYTVCPRPSLKSPIPARSEHALDPRRGKPADLGAHGIKNGPKTNIPSLLPVSVGWPSGPSPARTAPFDRIRDGDETQLVEDWMRRPSQSGAGPLDPKCEAGQPDCAWMGYRSGQEAEEP